jgi:hypothetical protein
LWEGRRHFQLRTPFVLQKLWEWRRFRNEDAVRCFVIGTFTYQVQQSIVRIPQQFVIFGRKREVWKSNGNKRESKE